MRANGNAAGADGAGGVKAEGATTGPRTLGPLIPATCKQIFNATVEDQKVMLGMLPANSVTVVAQVRAKVETSSYIEFHLDDGTALVKARLWVDSEVPAEARPCQNINENAYVRVFGGVSLLGSEPCFIARRVCELPDMNHLTFHLAQCLETKLMYQRGLEGGVHNNDGMEDAGHYVEGGASESQFKNALQSMIYKLIQQNISKEGKHINEIYTQLGSKASAPEILELIKDLVSKGLIFTTIDNDHFSAQ